jgi:hypothetical protein
MLLLEYRLECAFPGYEATSSIIDILWPQTSQGFELDLYNVMWNKHIAE